MNTVRIRQAIKILIYLSALMPLLVFSDSTIFPFVFGKAVYFRVIVEIMLSLYLLLVALDSNYRPRLTPIFWAVTAWLAALTLATIFGVDPVRSFWGNHERMSGLFTLIHFAAYFMVLTGLRWPWSEWKSFLRYLLLISLIVGLTGLNFLLSPDSIMKIGGGGTLGNQIYLANFLLFHVFIAWLLWRREEVLFWRWFAGLIGLVEIAMMISNGKRGPILGLILGASVGAIVYILRSSRVRIWKTKVLAGSFLILVIFSSILYYARDTKLVSRIPLVVSLTHINLKGGTAATRLIAWEIAVKAWKERPIFGWGVENFYYAFNLFYNPKSLEHGYYETWFDRSHNIFFDYLSMGGVAGLASYLAVFGIIFWQLRKRRAKLTTDELAVTLMFFSAYILQNFFVFDHLSSYLTFFIFLAWTDGFVSGQPLASKVEGGSRSVRDDHPAVNYNLFLLWSAITLGILAAMYFGNVAAWRANTASFTAQQMLPTKFAEGLDKYREIFKKSSPHIDDIRSDLGRVLATALGQNPKLLADEKIRAGWELAVSELKKTLDQHPRELNARLFLAQFYALFLLDPQMAKLTEQEFAEALKLSPKRQLILYQWSRVKLLQRDYDGARQLLEQAVKDDPKIAVTYWYLGVLEAESGHMAASSRIIREAFERGYSPQSEGESIFAADILKDNKDYALAKDFYAKVLVNRPSDPALMLKLSEVSMLSGDKIRAVEFAERAALYDPKALETARQWLR